MAVAGIIVGKNFITAMVNGSTQTINEQHPNYAKIRNAVKTKDMDAVESLINISNSVANYAVGKVRVDAGRVFYGTLEVHGVVVDRILDMMREGFDAAPMLNFLDNLMKNPSKRAVDELYLFLEQTSLPITEDGHFLAYKKVKDDYKDFYTGTMDNSIGKVLEMPRNSVDDERSRTCSQGLHFCSLSYLPHYYGNQGHVMIVKINPADVVSIPSDYNNAKGRTCRYEVIGEHTCENMEAFFTPVYTGPDSATDSYDDEEYDEEYDDESYDDEESDGEYAAGYLASRAMQTSNKPDTAVQHNGNQSPGLEGYNRGRSDAAAGRRYSDTSPLGNCGTAEYELSYSAAYAKGWDSIKIGN